MKEIEIGKQELPSSIFLSRNFHVSLPKTILTLKRMMNFGIVKMKIFEQANALVIDNGTNYLVKDSNQNCIMCLELSSFYACCIANSFFQQLSFLNDTL